MMDTEKHDDYLSEAAGIVIVRNDIADARRFLVLVTPDGEYDLPKGRCEGNDPDDASCAMRELAEETGLRRPMFTWGRTSISYSRLRFFIAETGPDDSVIHRPNRSTGIIEHVGHLWLMLDDAMRRLPAFLRPAIAWADGVAGGTIHP